MRLTKEQAQKRYPDVRFFGNIFYIQLGAYIGDGAIIRERVDIGVGVVIRKGADIGKAVIIREGADIGKAVIIREGVYIGEGAKNVTDCLVIHGLGKTKNLTAYICDKGLEIVIGCFRGNLKEAQEQIDKKYPDEHSYNYAMLLIQKWAEEKIRQEEK